MTTKTSSKTQETSSTDDMADKPKAAVDPSTETNVSAMVRRKEMVERIVAKSGLKPNEVKTMLDAVLSELGDALSAGEALNLHPLGKVTVNQQKKMGGKEILICKIRRKLPEADVHEALDTAAE
jgi:nucleoid DNA-binding protein